MTKLSVVDPPPPPSPLQPPGAGGVARDSCMCVWHRTGYSGVDLEPFSGCASLMEKLT